MFRILATLSMIPNSARVLVDSMFIFWKINAVELLFFEILSRVVPLTWIPAPAA